MIRRREFITLLGGAAVAVPCATKAQPKDRMRRVGVLMNTVPDEPQAQARIAAFSQALQELGWAIDRNVRIEIRWSGGDAARLRRDATELVGLNPDIILAGVGPTTEALRAASRSVPIVFAQSVDPVGSGQVASLARPGGNATGFLQFEYGLSGKWPELLKEVAPRVTRVAVLRDGGAAGIGQWAVIQAMASPLGLELSPIVGSAAEIERGVSALAQVSNGGLIVAVGVTSQIYHELIITLAARHRLPVIYPYRFFVTGGGLISYGPELLSQYRRAASYVDRILRGETPGDLPVQAPTKYEMVLNLKTAKTLGLDIPASVLARADEVIE